MIRKMQFLGKNESRAPQSGQSSLNYRFLASMN